MVIGPTAGRKDVHAAFLVRVFPESQHQKVQDAARGGALLHPDVFRRTRGEGRAGVRSPNKEPPPMSKVDEVFCKQVAKVSRAKKLSPARRTRIHDLLKVKPRVGNDKPRA
jgi:hypothetical protein